VSVTKLDLEEQILDLMGEWADSVANDRPEKVRYSGPMFGRAEYQALLRAVFDGWWSAGKHTIEAERKLAHLSERSHGLLANSGSSANLLLMSAAKHVYGWPDGSRILTLACGFPTTVNPIIQNRMVPVFADIDLDGLDLTPAVAADALDQCPDVRAIFVAHTLGFPCDVDGLADLARSRGIEAFFDCCDAYGSTWSGRPVPAYGKAATFSFYVAHHATMGEGGGIVTNDPELHIAIRSMRNWGRYCAAAECCIRAERPDLFCPPARLTRNSTLPEDYAVNYQYEYLGYNLKPLDLQAAMLVPQLDRLPEFNEARIGNYEKLLARIDSPHLRTWPLREGISPFAFPILIDERAPFKRKHIVDHLTRDHIETRLLFGGNLARHPAYLKEKIVSVGSLSNSDAIMHRFFMVGCAPVVSDADIDRMTSSIERFLAQW
jgi:dTDP-4-amino-4,6-dideoxygalactose transaminase